MLARPCAAHAGRPQAPGDVISRVRAARVPTPPRRRRVSVLPDGLGGDTASAASSAAAAAADQLELLDFEAASASLSANATAAAAAANAAAETALTILASVARAAGTNIETVLSNGAVAAFGAFIGGALAWQLATLQAKARAEVAARAATREALNALDPEALTKVLGELPSWLAYRCAPPRVPAASAVSVASAPPSLTRDAVPPRPLLTHSRAPPESSQRLRARRLAEPRAGQGVAVSRCGDVRPHRAGARARAGGDAPRVPHLPPLPALLLRLHPRENRGREGVQRGRRGRRGGAHLKSFNSSTMHRRF